MNLRTMLFGVPYDPDGVMERERDHALFRRKQRIDVLRMLAAIVIVLYSITCLIRFLIVINASPVEIHYYPILDWPMWLLGQIHNLLHR